MKIFVFVSFIVCLFTIISPVEIFADTALDVYMNDFYSLSYIWHFFYDFIWNKAFN